jgi:pSer/pThr/pTyr-binding forkhead associated (FHA) protein
MTGIALTVEPRAEAGEPLRLTFGADAVVVGRSAGCDVCLPHPAVSARHLEIRREGRDWYATDLASANGTRLGEKLLPPRVPQLLRDGDVLGVSGFRLRVELDVPVDVGTASSTALLGRRLLRDVLARLRPDHAQPRLRVVAGPDAGREASLDAVGAEVRIGRAESCELRLTDALASREHAVVRRDVAGLVLLDRGGKNPTEVSGTRVEGERRLRDRDEIAIGNSRIAVSDPAEALAHEIEQLPDEAWLSPPPPSPPEPACPARAPRRRGGWEWLIVGASLAAMAGAAYAIWTLLAG